ncbi:MAG: type I-E CRISPR-associated protein Cas5/CasD [Hyphomicrobiaceae bacterium]
MTSEPTRYLLFTLAAPLASFGTIAVGERRPTWDRPSKSQVIGLIAGCLGIERTEDDRQRELAQSLGFAVRVDNPGLLATDYHTTQAATGVSIRKRLRAGGSVATRAEELACDDLKTILSRREVRVGSLYTIAVWKISHHGASLDKIASDLMAPKFAPFAGRKSNPLALPFGPRILEADRIESAFTLFSKDEPQALRNLKAAHWSRPRDDAPIYVDATAIPAGEREQRVSRLEQRRDDPESRTKWRFGLRAEALLRSRPAEDQS